MVTGSLLAMVACSGRPLRVGTRDPAAQGGRGGASAGDGTGGVAGRTDTGGAGRDGAPSDWVPDVSPALSADQVCRDAIVAQCERLYACQGFSPGDCAQYAADRCPDFYFGPHTLRTVENVAACVPHIRQASCTAFLMGNATECLLGGLGAAGAPCSSPSECASSSCSELFPNCGTCSAVLALGESCDVSAGHCASGTLCHPKTRVCVSTPLVVAHAPEGLPCDLAGDPLVGCQGDLVCVPTRSGGTAGRCAHLPRQSEPCLTVSTLPPCAPGLRCGPYVAGDVRARLCDDQQPCGATFCDANGFCNESGGQAGGCLPYAKVGEACSKASDSERICGQDSFCAVDARAGDGAPATEGTCALLNQLELGAACDSSRACRSSFLCQAGRCTRFEPATCFLPADGGGM
jgi:hypothetical protein